MAPPNNRRRDTNSSGGSAAAPEQTTTPEAQPEQAPEAPQGEPGPEEFERHSGARLLEEHAADLELRDAIERRLEKRAHVIATRAMKAKGRGEVPVIQIAGRDFQPRARPAKFGGGMLLAEMGKRTTATLDP